MSDVSSPMIKNKDENRTMSPDEVLEFLRANPDFLAENPDVLDDMSVPDLPKTKGIADFQSYMIRSLKQSKEKAAQTTREIVENARSNMNNQQRIHKAVLRLLEADSFHDFLETIISDLPAMLDVDIAVLVVEARGNVIPHIHQSSIRMVPEGTVDRWMAGKNVLLQDDISGIEAVYGGGATLVRSQIMLRVDISMDTPPAILAFGSRDPHLFQPGQATDQILFLTRVIERCFRMWLRSET